MAEKNRSGIFLAIIGAITQCQPSADRAAPASGRPRSASLRLIAAAVIGFGFVGLNTSQETRARNIEEISPLLARVEALEDESDRYRVYYLEIAQKLADVNAEIKTLNSRQSFMRAQLDWQALLDRFVLLEGRFYDRLFSEKEN